MTGNNHPDYKVFLFDDGGAHVVVTHKGGHQETWDGFATEEEAKAWVAKERAKPPPQSKIGKPAPR
jgi:hypothetical protein